MPAEIGWVLAGPQPDPPGKYTISAIAVQSLPPRPAMGLWCHPALGRNGWRPTTRLKTVITDGFAQELTAPAPVSAPRSMAS